MCWPIDLVKITISATKATVSFYRSSKPPIVSSRLTFLDIHAPSFFGSISLCVFIIIDTNFREPLTNLEHSPNVASVTRTGGACELGATIRTQFSDKLRATE